MGEVVPARTSPALGSYLASPTSPIPSHCASIVATSTLRVKAPAGMTWGLKIANTRMEGHLKLGPDKQYR